MITTMLFLAIAIQSGDLAPSEPNSIIDDQVSVRAAWLTSDEGGFECKIVETSGDTQADKRACDVIRQMNRGPEGEVLISFNSEETEAGGFRTEGAFSTPDEIDAAVVPFMECLIAANGHTGDLPKFPAPEFAGDDDCRKMKAWSRARGLQILASQGDPRTQTEREALVDASLDAIDSHVPRNPNARQSKAK